LRTKHLIALALAYALTTPLYAADSATPKAAEKATSKSSKSSATLVTTVEGITEYKLANGLRILLAPDASKPTTTVNVTYLVGSRHENYGETGMAHLLEHMVFKGTKTRGNMMQELGKRGMQFNGTTFFDRTNYYETFSANDENLKWALEMEADRMVNSLIDRRDLETEFSVVRNELERGENNPVGVLWKQLSAATFDWHNYGKTTIGSRADIENVKIENLQAFYRKYYQPDNAVLLVAGKFDPPQTIKLISKVFGRIPKPSRQLAQTYTTESPRDGAREVHVQRTTDQYLLASLYPTSAGSHADSSAINALGEILAGTPNGRLHKNLVETKKAVGVQAWPFDLAEPGYVLFLLQLNKDNDLVDARKLMLSDIESIAKQPITEAELKRAKNALLADFDKTVNDPQRLAVAMSESISLGDWRMFFIQRDRIEALKLADVQAAAENYFRESNRSFGQFTPVEKPVRTVIPATPDVAKLVANYEGRKATAEGEVFDATPANIDARTVRSTLANGAKLALLPKKTRGEIVKGAIDLHFGDEKALFGKRTLGSLTGSMLNRGAGKLTRAEMSAKLDEIKARLQVGGSGAAVSVRFEVPRKHLPELLDLMRDTLRAPTFPVNEFEQLIKENLTRVDAMRKEPSVVAQVALQQSTNVYPKGDVRNQGTLEEVAASIQATTLQDVTDFYRQFYSAENAQISLVGDFDAEPVKKILEQHYGDWKIAQPYKRLATLMPAVKPEQVALEVADKPNANLMAMTAFPLQDTDPDYPAMLVANEVLGGGTKSRLFDRLRQKEGISYGAGSGFRADPEDKVGTVTLTASFAPQFRTRIEQALSEEVRRFAKDGITATELADAKLALKQERSIARAQDATLAATIAGQMRLGRTMALSAKIDAVLAALTLDHVNASIRKYIKPDQFMLVVAGDFAGAAKAAAEKK
jgi:zinc protease